MRTLNSSFKNALIEDFLDSIYSNTALYYAFASNPIAYVGNTPAVTSDDYSSYFVPDWQMLFGKKLNVSNIAPVVKNNVWTSNTVYDMYDNLDTTLHDNLNFFVISPPEYVGGSYNFYKCISNANGSPSTVKPNLVQPTTFETSDGYKWRYLTSISYKQYKTFSTDDFAPIFANNITSIYASLYSGVDFIEVANSGSGYIAHHDGLVQSANSTVIQIENSASNQTEHYTNSAIYIFNESSTTSQLFRISQYVSNSSGNWVYVDGQANTDNILFESTKYKISPRVIFHTDANTSPSAYSVVNTSTTGITNVVILDSGSDLSWATITLGCNFGNGAVLRPVTPPPGGHGSDVLTELDVSGVSICFSFANTESNTIMTSNLVYNKIGLIKNPYILEANGTKGNAYSTNTFNQVISANIATPSVYIVGEQVTGYESGAKATVVLSNTTQIYLVGDKNFVDGESIVSANGTQVANITINSIGDIYTKDLFPLYMQNINNVNRSNTQTESFKLIIQF